eukprot:CAMPEP_0114978824 /NCGR_PEP_ID=MMETSP0216-20121206/4028_1 /TAXON_ID=223996 /ORGANISM="Protocruzia adherens, Strain Boccale" /LENGTH=1040 /DNA_ID=CAMNT_0002340077 /DNA_START=347 /DNA_END=3465 /DNA_ORIENTATION=+
MTFASNAEYYFNPTLKTCLPCEIKLDFELDLFGDKEHTLLELENADELYFYAISGLSLRVSSCQSVAVEYKFWKNGNLIASPSSRMLADPQESIFNFNSQEFSPDDSLELEVTVIPSSNTSWQIVGPKMKLLPRSGAPPRIKNISSSNPLLSPTGVNELEVEMKLYDEDLVFVWSADPSDLQFLSSNRRPRLRFQNRIDGSALIPGTTYQFTITVANKFEAITETISFQVNSPPNSGDFIITPTQGTELQTHFQHTYPGWTDDSSQPLSYHLTRILPDGTERLISTHNSHTTQYPAGDPANNHTVTLALYVYDAQRAYTRITKSIQIFTEKSGENLQLSVTNSLEALENGPVDDVQAVCSQVVVVHETVFSVANGGLTGTSKGEYMDSLLKVMAEVSKQSVGDGDTQQIALIAMDEISGSQEFMTTDRVDAAMETYERLLTDPQEINSQQVEIVTSGLDYITQTVVNQEVEDSRRKEVHEKINRNLSQVYSSFIKTGWEAKSQQKNLAVAFESLRGFQLNNLEVEVLLDDNQKAVVRFPSTTSQFTASLDQKIGVQLIWRRFNTHPLRSAELEAISSNTLEVIIMDVASENEIKVRDSEEIVLEIPDIMVAELFPASVQGNKDEMMKTRERLQCVFWDVAQEKWSTEGCDQRFDSTGQFFCLCKHLSEFTVARKLQKTVKESNISELTKYQTISKLEVENAIGVYTLILLSVMLILSLGYASAKDTQSEFKIATSAAYYQTVEKYRDGGEEQSEDVGISAVATSLESTMKLARRTVRHDANDLEMTLKSKGSKYDSELDFESLVDLEGDQTTRRPMLSGHDTDGLKVSPHEKTRAKLRSLEEQEDVYQLPKRDKVRKSSQKKRLSAIPRRRMAKRESKGLPKELKLLSDMKFVSDKEEMVVKGKELSFWKTLLVKHPLSSVILTHSVRMSRMARVVVVYAVIIGQITLVGSFYRFSEQREDEEDKDEQNDSIGEIFWNLREEDIYISVISIVIIVPFTFLLEELFTKRCLDLNTSHEEQRSVYRRNKIKLSIAKSLAVVW